LCDEGQGAAQFCGTHGGHWPDQEQSWTHRLRLPTIGIADFCPRTASGNAAAPPSKLRDRCQHLSPMPERDAKLFEVLIGQMREYRDIDSGRAPGIYVRSARSILSNALNFCRSAIAAFVRSL
jgi:hypothetical protein